MNYSKYIALILTGACLLTGCSYTNNIKGLNGQYTKGNSKTVEGLEGLDIRKQYPEQIEGLNGQYTKGNSKTVEGLEGLDIREKYPEQIEGLNGQSTKPDSLDQRL